MTVRFIQCSPCYPYLQCVWGSTCNATSQMADQVSNWALQEPASHQTLEQCMRDVLYMAYLPSRPLCSPYRVYFFHGNHEMPECKCGFYPLWSLGWWCAWCCLCRPILQELWKSPVNGDKRPDVHSVHPLHSSTEIWLKIREYWMLSMLILKLTDNYLTNNKSIL